MPRRRRQPSPRGGYQNQRGNIDLSGPTGRYVRGRGGGNTGQGRTENINKYKSAAQIRAENLARKRRKRK